MIREWCEESTELGLGLDSSRNRSWKVRSRDDAQSEMGLELLARTSGRGSLKSVAELLALAEPWRLTKLGEPRVAFSERRPPAACR